MALKIRQYRASDRAALVACIKELQQYIGALDDFKRTRTSADFDGEAYVQRLFEKVQGQQGAIYLADDNGSIVGCIAGIIPALTEDDILEGYPSRDGKILELYVQPNYRGQKVGFGLMRAMEQYFQRAGCKGCHVDCFAPNVAAHVFYRKIGYVDRLTTLLKIFP